MTTTRITSTTAGMIDSTFYNGFEADFDTDAVEQDWRGMVEASARETVPSLALLPNGDVIAEVGDAEAAAELDWDEIAYGLGDQFSTLLERHAL